MGYVKYLLVGDMDSYVREGLVCRDVDTYRIFKIESGDDWVEVYQLKEFSNDERKWEKIPVDEVDYKEKDENDGWGNPNFH